MWWLPPVPFVSSDTWLDTARERERTGRPSTRLGVVWRFMFYGGLLAAALQALFALALCVFGWFEAGDIAEDELPRDVLMVLLRNQDKVDLSRESLRREIAFYLLAGAHTSATAFTRCMHNIFKWLDAHPEDAQRVRNDRIFVQRCTHETIRLQGSSPTSQRWALADLELSSGIKIAKGDRVTIDLNQANRSTDIYGADAEEFNPDRVLADGATPWGRSFGQGMHACIGQDLAAGLSFDSEATEQDHLFGLVPVAVQTMFDHGCLPDPDSPPELDDSTTRPYFGKYPVVFTG